MSFILKLTDSVNTIDFISTAVQLADGGLVISAPEQVQTWTDPSDKAGPQLSNSRLGNRTILITFAITGTTRKAIRDTMGTINMLCKTAIDHSLGHTAKRVAFLYAWDEEDTLDHFEVLSGKLTVPEDIMSVTQMHGKVNGRYTVEGFELELVTAPTAYGLDPSNPTQTLIELPLTNRNGTKKLGGLAIGDFYDPVAEFGIKVDGKTFYHDNFVEIDPADMEGDAPAKLRIEITDVIQQSTFDHIQMGLTNVIAAKRDFAWNDPDLAINPTVGKLTIHNVSYSPTKKMAWVFNNNKPFTGADWEPAFSPLIKLKLSDPSVYKGKRNRIICRSGYWPFYYAKDFPLQFSIRTTLGTTAYTGPWTVQPYPGPSTRAMIWDMGILPLPPYPEKLTNPEPLWMCLGANYDSDATMNHFSLNQLSLFPVDLGYRVLDFNAPWLYDQNPDFNTGKLKIVDDGWNDITYMESTVTGKRSGTVLALYSPLMINPADGKQRIYFAFTGHHYLPQAEFVYKIRVYYAPAFQGAV